MLLQAGADPTIPSVSTQMSPLDIARHQAEGCIPLLEAAMAEPNRPRTLIKARALLDVIRLCCVVEPHFAALGLPKEPKQHIWELAGPAYLKGQLAAGQALPRVSIEHGVEEEKLAACIKYALGLEGGGGVVLEGQEPTVGMLPEVFVVLCEMLVPKWARGEM